MPKKVNMQMKSTTCPTVTAKFGSIYSHYFFPLSKEMHVARAVAEIFEPE